MAPPYSQAVLALAIKVGGVPSLASRCAASEAAVLAWIAGQLLPSRDEHFLLGLIARKHGVTLPAQTAPHGSGGAPKSASDDPGTRAAGDDDYREWVKTQE